LSFEPGNIFCIQAGGHRDLSLAELLTAEEVFNTGTNKMIVPGVQVDDKVIGAGRPGRHTQNLMNAFSIRVDEYYKNQKEALYVGQ
jgi:hypothetical protein